MDAEYLEEIKERINDGRPIRRIEVKALLAEAERLTAEVKCLDNEYHHYRRLSENADKQIVTLKKKLEEITKTKNDYFGQMQSYIRAFRLHQSALELACTYFERKQGKMVEESEYQARVDAECFIQQAQEREQEDRNA